MSEHSERVEQLLAPGRAELGRAKTGEPEGVWMCAHSYPHEGIVTAIPYASELDALRAANNGDVGRAVFVPYGKDLREVLNA